MVANIYDKHELNIQILLEKISSLRDELEAMKINLHMSEDYIEILEKQVWELQDAANKADPKLERAADPKVTVEPVWNTDEFYKDPTLVKAYSDSAYAK